MAASLAAAVAHSLPRPTAAAEIDLGAELRLQIDSISSDTFGTVSESRDTIWQERALASADVTHGNARLFAQLGISEASGRNGGASPVDESDFDAQQAFVELAWPVLGQLRAGRQEWSFGSGRLVSVRDGPNIRRAFDAVRFDHSTGSGTIRLLYGRPVSNRSGSFDDRANQEQSLAGIYGTWPLASANSSLELYWLNLRRDAAEFAAATGSERRDSWGLRWSGKRGAWSYDTEAVLQTGNFAGQAIRAWTLATDTRYRLGALQLGLKLDIASGDSNLHDGRLETFNALYPNPSYFSEAALISPANLIDAQPFMHWDVSDRLSVHAGWDVIWKHRRTDAIYATPVPLTPVAHTEGTSQFIGQQLQAVMAWQVARHTLLEGSYVHFIAGSGLREAGGEDVDFVQIKLTLSY